VKKSDLLYPFALKRAALALSLLAIAGACGKDGTTGPSEPTLLVFKSGEGQSGPVGTALTSKVIVEARNSRGPIADVNIAMATEAQGGGSVSPQSAKTGTDGTAQFTWTLGSKLGVQTLTASTAGTTPLHASLSATALAAPASIVLPTSETLQFVVVGRAVNTLPTVQVTDAFGNPIGGVAVSFDAVAGASVLGGTSQTSDAQGHATLGGWTLGAAAGSYTVRATIASGATALFEARGIPAAVVAIAGNNQTANVGTVLPVLPAVKATRDDGSGLPNVAITFAVTSGGGVLTGTSAVTGADGTARPVQWILGTTPGVNRLEATTQGQPVAVLFTATGLAATPAFAVASGGTSLNGLFGNFLLGNPEVTVTDAQGNPVAGTPVNFQVTQGGGQITGVSVPTDFRGRAATTSWRLGSVGTQSMSATVGALPPLVFTAAGSDPPAGSFKIEVRYKQTPTASQKAAFDAAVARWTQLLVGGPPPYQVVPTDIDPTGDCPSMLNETVDGLVIYADLKPIDGVGRILGATGLCVIRDNGFLPVEGLMQFDTADLANLEASGQLIAVITHEMGHALGYGTLWDISIPGLGSIHLREGVPGSDPTFNGPAARAAFYGAVAPGTAFSGTPVPIENIGGAGTAFVHWREATFTNELMTGFLSAGFNPLSAMTVQQFRDLGYVVNDASADAYTFAAAVQSFGAPSIQLGEAQLQGPIVVINRNGGVVARIPRIFK
jgi:hypothetical protein